MDTKQIGLGGERVFVDFLKYMYTANFFCVCLLANRHKFGLLLL